jgi:hypothetical protein
MMREQNRITTEPESPATLTVIGASPFASNGGTSGLTRGNFPPCSPLIRNETEIESLACREGRATLVEPDGFRSGRNIAGFAGKLSSLQTLEKKQNRKIHA